MGGGETWRLATTAFPSQHPSLTSATATHPGLSPQTPADLQEVTYAQLDHRTLTQRAARAVTPPSTEPAAESSTYAAISRH